MLERRVCLFHLVLSGVIITSRSGITSFMRIAISLTEIHCRDENLRSSKWLICSFLLKVHDTIIFSRPQFPNCVSPVSSGTPAAGPYAYQAQPMGNPSGAAVPPIQNQPSGTIWMPIPPPIPNCPPGLEYLTQVPAPFILPQETGGHLRSSLHLGES